MSTIADLADRIEKAKRKLNDAVAAEYPVGCHVVAERGGHEIEGVVIDHGAWWNDPSEVRIVNSRTGKIRRVSATYDGHKLRRIGP